MVSEHTKARILVVGDRPPVRLSLVAFLIGADFSVLEASDAAEGLERFEAQQPDAVFIDLAMPGRIGLELLEEIKKRAPRVPILVVSEFGQISDAITALQLGAWDHISLPIRDIVVFDNFISKALKRAESIVQNRGRHELELEKRINQLELGRERLRRIEKLQAVGLLAGGVAHDINNLLSGISGYAELAKMYAEQGSKSARYLDNIINAVRNAGDLNSKLLSFSRMGPYKALPFDINDVVLDVVDLIEHIFDDRVVVEGHVAPQPQVVEADKSQLQSVLVDLAVNARNAMPKGGKLTLSTAPRTIEFGDRAPDDPPAGEYVRLTVRDTGAGMDSETVEQLFEPFSSPKGLEQWTGLGLAVVRSTVEEAGGKIRVESTPGKGTSVMLFLPLHPKRFEEGVLK